jgi:hypothetical protein
MHTSNHDFSRKNIWKCSNEDNLIVQKLYNYFSYVKSDKNILWHNDNNHDGKILEKLNIFMREINKNKQDYYFDINNMPENILNPTSCPSLKIHFYPNPIINICDNYTTTYQNSEINLKYFYF